MSLSHQLKQQLSDGLQLLRRKAALLSSCLQEVVLLLAESADIEARCSSRSLPAEARFKQCKRAVFELKRQALDVSAKIDEIECQSKSLPFAGRASLALTALSRVALVYRQALKCLQMYLQIGSLDGEAVGLFGRLLGICMKHVCGLMARVDASYHSNVLDVQKLLTPLNGKLSEFRWRCLVHGFFENIDVDAFDAVTSYDSPAFPEVLLARSRTESVADFKLYPVKDLASESGVNDLSVLSSRHLCADNEVTGGVATCCRRDCGGRCDNEVISRLKEDCHHPAVEKDHEHHVVNDNQHNYNVCENCENSAVNKGRSHLVSEENNCNPVLNKHQCHSIMGRRRDHVDKNHRRSVQSVDCPHFTTKNNHSQSPMMKSHRYPAKRTDLDIVSERHHRNPPEKEFYRDIASDRINFAEKEVHRHVVSDRLCPAQKEVHHHVVSDRLNPAEREVLRPMVTDHQIPAEKELRRPVASDRLNPAEEEPHRSVDKTEDRHHPAVNGDLHPVAECGGLDRGPNSNCFTHVSHGDARVDEILHEFVMSDDVGALLTALMQQEASLINSIANTC